jgi:hypothetical protein
MSHTGNANGNFGVEGLRQTRVLTPVMAAQNLRKVLHCWYNADFLNVDANGLVSGASDLTGKGNDGIQATESRRLTHFPSDLQFKGKPSFGSLTTTGSRRLEVSGGSISLSTEARIILSCFYSDGLASGFSSVNGLVHGGSTTSDPRVFGNGGSWGSLLLTGSYSKNGGAYFTQATSPLPLPASTLALRPGTNTANLPWSFGAELSSINRTWVGGFRNIIITNSSITNLDISLIEGVIAWDGDHQNRLAANHPYRFIPPLVRD